MLTGDPGRSRPDHRRQLRQPIPVLSSDKQAVRARDTGRAEVPDDGPDAVGWWQRFGIGLRHVGSASALMWPTAEVAG